MIATHQDTMTQLVVKYLLAVCWLVGLIAPFISQRSQAADIISKVFGLGAQFVEPFALVGAQVAFLSTGFIHDDAQLDVEGGYLQAELKPFFMSWFILI